MSTLDVSFLTSTSEDDLALHKPFQDIIHK